MTWEIPCPQPSNKHAFTTSFIQQAFTGHLLCPSTELSQVYTDGFLAHFIFSRMPIRYEMVWK